MKHSRRNRRHGVAPGYKMAKDHVDRASKVLLATKNGGVGVTYVGPSVEGGDKEYVKVLTGNVDSRKPSFV
ncbi:hypothetical protein D3C76_153570 [compost metagenome]